MSSFGVVAGHNADGRAIARQYKSNTIALSAVLLLAMAMIALSPQATAANASDASDAPAWEPIPPAAWNQAARPDSGGRDAIILSQRGEDWDRQGDFRYAVFRRIRVFTSEGRDAGEVEITHPQSWRVEAIRARSVRPDGTITELAANQITHTVVAKRGGREVGRESFIVPGIEPGCIIEYQYALSGKHANTWHSTYYFQYPHYTCEAVYTLHPSEWDLGPGRGVRWQFRKILSGSVSVRQEPDSIAPKTITFRAVSLPGLKVEEFAPPAADAGARVITYYAEADLQPATYWSFWMRAMQAVGDQFGQDLGPLEAVVQYAQRLTSDPLQALAIVHRWLQTHVRSIDEQSWKERREQSVHPRFELVTGRFEDPQHPGWPIEAGQVVVGPLNKHSPVSSLIEHGWGTPYEINAALVAAAHRLGLEASVAFTGDRRDDPFDYQVIASWPSEVISAARPRGGKWRFYDPASEFSPSGSIPWYLRGGKALLGGSVEGELVAIVHAEDGAPAQSEWRLDLTLDPTGTVDGPLTANYGGEAARDLKAQLWPEDPDQWVAKLQENLAKSGKPKLEFERPDLATDPDSTFSLKAHLHYPAFASAVGGVMTLPMDQLLPWRFRADFQNERRNQSLLFRHRRHQTIRVDLHLPAGATAQDLPAPRRFENECGSFQTTWTPTPDGARLERTVQINLAEVDRRDYAMVREFFRTLAVADGDVLLVSMK